MNMNFMNFLPLKSELYELSPKGNMNFMNFSPLKSELYELFTAQK